MTRDGAIQAILEELNRAQSKFPMWPVDPIHASAIVEEESGELMRAALQFSYEEGAAVCMTDEAIQVGAMALRFLMGVGNYNRVRSWQALQPREGTE